MTGVPLRAVLSSRRAGIAVAAILLVALALRVALVLETWEDTPQREANEYDRHAVSIAHGDGYPTPAAFEILEPLDGETAYRLPLYPAVLAGVYAISGTGPERIPIARLAQAILGTVLVALIGLMGLRLASPGVGFVTMALAAVWPPMIALGSALLTEQLFTTLVLLCVLVTLAARREHGVRWALVLGLLSGLAILTRLNGPLVALVAAGALWRRPLPSVRALRRPILVLAVAAAVVAPWTIRNAVALHTFVPVSTSVGYGLYGTYNEAARTDPSCHACWRVDLGYLVLSIARLGEVEAGRRVQGEALREIADHPGYVVVVSAYNTGRMLGLAGFDFERFVFSIDIGTGRTWDTLAAAGVVAIVLLLPLAAAGLFTREARRMPRFVWVLAALLFVSAVPVHGGTSRYRGVVDPFLLLAAGCALAATWSRRRERRRAADAAPVASAGHLGEVA